MDESLRAGGFTARIGWTGAVLFGELPHLCFEFVSDLEFQYSDLAAAGSKPGDAGMLG
jgi:hypothetical protein